MASRVIELQQADGLWRSDLNDPKSFPEPETSGSSFFVYALGWGINHCLLDRQTYQPAVTKGLGGAQSSRGPPLWIAQKIHDQSTSMNPTYELSYWARGLEIAQQWRERLGMPRDADWEKRRTNLSALPQKDGKYVALESHPDTWDNVESRHDHPSFLVALGQLPGDGVDRAVMRRTLDAVLAKWDWTTKIWGWDYPMIAMTAARLEAPELAVDVLLKSAGPNTVTRKPGTIPLERLMAARPRCSRWLSIATSL